MNFSKLVGGCFIITTSCNMKCPMCYAYSSDEATDIHKKKKIIDKMADLGIIKIMFSGGEPLLDENLIDLIKYAKSKEFKTALSSNGLLLSEDILHKLDNHLDELSLPLEGSNPSIHKHNRGSQEHFFIIKHLLEIISDYNFKTDIETVVTKYNKNDISNILELILDNNIKKWKLFQFYSLGRGLLNSEDYQVSNYEFAEIKERFSKYKNIEIDFRDNDELVMKSYLNISPSGDIITVLNNKYVKIGNLLYSKNIYSILHKNNFNFEIHNKRHWRDFQGGISNEI